MGSFPTVVGRRRTSVLVGRRAELDLLDEALTLVRRGSGQVVVVNGDAGIGKSRLIEEFASRHDNVLVATGHCVDASTDALAYAPWAELLWWLMRAVGDDIIGEERLALSRLLPEIDITDEPAEGGRELLLEAVITVLNRIATTRALVIVIEDLHWIDAASRDILLGIARNLRRLPILVIATHRPVRSEDLENLTGQLHREGGISLRIAALPDDDAADVASQLIGTEIDAAEVLDVVNRAGGNPLFVEELVAALGEETLPDTIRHLLLSRFNALDADAQHLVRSAAVIGQQAPRNWLANASNFSKETNRSATRTAVDAGILISATDRRSYVFAHSLLRDAVLEDLLPDDLVDLHEAAARALEEQPVASEEIDTVAELARHWDAAEVPAKALQWTVAAADQAAHRYAFESALALFRRALLWWDAVDDAAEVAGRSRAELLFDAADAAGDAGSLDDAAALATAAVEARGALPATEAFIRARRHLWAVQRAEDLRELAATALTQLDDADSTDQLRFLTEYSMFLILEPRPEEVLKLETRILDTSRAVDDPPLRARIHLLFAWVFESLGDAARAEEEFRSGIALARRQELASLLALITYNYASFLSSLSRREDCLQVLSDADRLIEAHGLRRLTVAVATLRAGELALIGELDEAEHALAHLANLEMAGVDREAFVAVSTRIAIYRGDETSQWFESAYNFDGSYDSERLMQWAFARAETLDLRGNPNEAALAIERAISGESGLDPYWFGFVAATGVRINVDLTLAGARNGDIDLIARERAERLAAAWRATAEAVHSPAPMIGAHGIAITGELARLDPSATAEPAIKAAQAFAAIGMPYYVAYWEWRAAEATIRIRGRQSPVPLLTSARKHAILHGFTGIERAIDRTARSEQLRLGSRSSVTEELLSAREVEVLRLLSKGRSNPEIADELVIGRRTVRTHVSNILQKLGASSRGEAVAVAHERQII